MFYKLFFLFFVFLLLQGCFSEPEQVLNGKTMGTTWSVKYIAPTKDSLQEKLEKRLFKINNLMSTYIADSELSLLNKKPIKQWHTISTELYDIISLANKISDLTNGAFDITVGSAVNYYGFGSEEITQLNKQVIGYKSISLKNNKIFKKQAVYMDLSAIAKGYAVDELALILDNAKIQNYLVEIGGEVKAKGKNSNNQIWQVAIENPSILKRELLQIISLDNEAIATSGSYRNFKIENDEIISHIIEPKKAKPVNGKVIATSVVHPSTAYADALATAFMILPVEISLKLAENNQYPLKIVTGNLKNNTIDQIYHSNYWK